MKRVWRYRCGARNRKRPNGKKRECGKRISLKQPVTWYRSTPKCPWCRSQHWLEDRHRYYELIKSTCKCSQAPYPHRRGTTASGGRWGRWECEHHIPF